MFQTRSVLQEAQALRGLFVLICPICSNVVSDSYQSLRAQRFLLSAARLLSKVYVSFSQLQLPHPGLRKVPSSRINQGPTWKI